MTGLEWREGSDPADTADVSAEIAVLVERAAAEDGTDALDDPARRDLAAWSRGEARPGVRGLLARDGDALVGYVHVRVADDVVADDVVAEGAVDPGHRRAGIGGALTDAVLTAYPGARAWAHGDHPGAAALAARHGLRRDRELWQMRRPPAPLPAVHVPDGVTIGPLRVGVDEPEVVAVNNRAFAWHPEQAGWTVDAVAELEREPWFDADGVLLARDADGTLLGFHWTKVHERSATVPERLGEVYVVGVDPAAQGRRLGSALTLAGLHHLHDRGLDTVILYVEGDNEAAIATYHRLGFERAAVDVSYRAGT